VRERQYGGDGEEGVLPSHTRYEEVSHYYCSSSPPKEERGG
jgi:hypothetical protein